MERHSQHIGHNKFDGQYHLDSYNHGQIFNNYADPSYLGDESLSWQFNNASGNAATSTALSQPVHLGTSWSDNISATSGLRSTDPFHAASLSSTQPPLYPANAQHASTFDPQLLNNTQHAAVYDVPSRQHVAPSSQNSTISPHALQAAPSAANQMENSTQPSASTQVPTVTVVDQPTLIRAIPRGTSNGQFSTINSDALSVATRSRPQNGFVHIALQEYEYPMNRAALPTPVPRRSRNQLYELARGNAALLQKLGKKTKRSRPKPNLVSSRTEARTSTTSVSDSSSEEDSSEYDSEDEPLQTFPLAQQRPDDVAKAVEYDSVKAVWRAKRSSANSADIRKGLSDYWEVVRTIRDRWKADTTAVTQAEEKKRVNDLPLLKKRVKDQRSMMEVALKAALQHGNRSILEHLSEVAAFLFVCYQFLVDRHKDNDIESELVRSILQLLALCSSLDQEKLEKVHMTKVLPRYLKKGSAEIQALIKSIEAKAKASTIQSSGDAALSSNVAKSADKSPIDNISTAKRPSSSSAPGPPAKKVAIEGAKETTRSTPISKINSTVSGVKKPVPVASTNKTLVKPASIMKPKVAPAKPTGFFSAMQSATKSSASVTQANAAPSSIAALAAKRLAEDAKPKSEPVAATQPKSTFSFASTLAGLTTNTGPTDTSQSRSSSETAAEKAKRLRRESRKALRVVFKPQDSLEEIRYFTHDPEEELENGAGVHKNIKGAKDLGEGMAFKDHKNNISVEDDDDDVQTIEELRSYHAPSLVDFAVIDLEERERNYNRFGGGLMEVESAERGLREKYEATVLSVVFADESEIPPTPREALADSAEPHAEVVQFGQPQGVTAERAAQIQAARAASTQTSGMAPTSTSSDISSLLASLQPQTPSAVPANVDQMSNLANVLAQFAPPGNAAHQPSVPLIPAGLQDSINNNLGSLQPPSQVQPPQAVDPNLASLLAQLQNGHALPPNASGSMPPGFDPIALMHNLQTQQQQQQDMQSQGQESSYENAERRRWRDHGDNNQENSRGGQQGGGRQQRPGAHSKQFTLPCKYWASGR